MAQVVWQKSKKVLRLPVVEIMLYNRPPGTFWSFHMLPEQLREQLKTKIAAEDHPGELAIEVMYALQNHYGYLLDTLVD